METDVRRWIETKVLAVVFVRAKCLLLSFVMKETRENNFLISLSLSSLSSPVRSFRSGLFCPSFFHTSTVYISRKRGKKNDVPLFLPYDVLSLRDSRLLHQVAQLIEHTDTGKKGRHDGRHHRLLTSLTRRC